MRDRVSELRRVLEPSLKRGARSHYVQTLRGGYRFDPPADCDIDSKRFERAYREGRALEGAGRGHEAVIHYERAAALYLGDYLAEERYEGWALAYQRHWRRIYWELLTRLGECYAGLGQYRRAIAWVERAFALEPTRSETVYRQLMGYYARAGDSAGMMRTYERLRQMLAEFFAAKPSPETRALYEAIRTEKLGNNPCRSSSSCSFGPA